MIGFLMMLGLVFFTWSLLFSYFPSIYVYVYGYFFILFYRRNLRHKYQIIKIKGGQLTIHASSPDLYTMYVCVCTVLISLIKRL